MILAIDGYEANSGNRVGIGRYALELLTHMERLVTSRRSAFEAVRIYLPEPPGSHMPKASDIWQYKVLRLKSFWTFMAFPAGLSMDSPYADVIFSPTHYIPRFVSIPKVMAIMDVSYLLYPELFRTEDLQKLTRWTSYSVRHAASIITISTFSKNAIIEAYGVPKSHVHVAYPALPDILMNDTLKTKSMTDKKLPKQYILSVGTLQPRKNYVRLIEAFSKLKGKDITLCIVGKKGWLYEDILSAPAKFGVTDRVRFLDYVSDSQLPELYKNAEVFALPSLYEGFGLPVLEAMAHGVPVVVSNNSSLPEIAGDAGYYVSPEDVGSIADGLQEALQEKGTDKGKERIKLGMKLASKFNWDTSAKKVLEVLEQVAGAAKK